MKPSQAFYSRTQKYERGNVIFYILMCVVLIGALTMYISGTGGSDQASGSTGFRMSEEIKSQAQGARSAIMECFLVYNAPYPTQPGSGLLSDAQCETTTGVFQNVFTSQSARAIPVPPNPFTAWKYTNTGGTFVKVSMDASAKASSQPVQIALKNLAQAYHASETSPNNGIYQNQDVCIITTAAVAEFHACLVSSSGVCGKAAPNNTSVGQNPCDP